MKPIFKIFTILICIFFICTDVHAMTTGFDIEEIEVDEDAGIFKTCKFELLDKEVKQRGIYCFDVNEYGYVALAFNNNASRDVILIYNEKNEFVYGYSFSPSGTYGVEWDSENLIIHLNREEVSLSFDSEGKCVEMATRASSTEKRILRMSEISRVLDQVIMKGFAEQRMNKVRFA